MSIILSNKLEDTLEDTNVDITNTNTNTNDNVQQDNLCSICLDLLDNNIITLPCDHVFHKKCIERWKIVNKKNTCPNCRENISNTESINNEYNFYHKKAFLFFLLMLLLISSFILYRYTTMGNINLSDNDDDNHYHYHKHKSGISHRHSHNKNTLH